MQESRPAVFMNFHIVSDPCGFRAYLLQDLLLAFSQRFVKNFANPQCLVRVDLHLQVLAAIRLPHTDKNLEYLLFIKRFVMAGHTVLAGVQIIRTQELHLEKAGVMAEFNLRKKIRCRAVRRMLKGRNVGIFCTGKWQMYLHHLSKLKHLTG